MHDRTAISKMKRQLRFVVTFDEAGKRMVLRDHAALYSIVGSTVAEWRHADQGDVLDPAAEHT